MTKRLLFPAFTYAWLATLATFPLLVATANLAVGASATLDLVQLVALAYSGYMTAWMIPATVFGLLAWPLTRVMLQRTAKRRGASIERLAFGAFLGATAGLVLGLALGVIPWIVLGMRGELPVDTMVTMIFGSATGLVWAAWFLLFAKLIGANKPEAPAEPPAD
jgi:hypothetical protein